MKMEEQRIGSLLHAAMRASLNAGAAILQVYESDDFDVEHKDDNSPLTRADRKAHSIIEECLKETMLPVLSEEGADVAFKERASWELYWLVDPLDGTKEFIKRNGEFTVNIALMARVLSDSGKLSFHAPAAGVVYLPVKDILYAGYSSRERERAWKIQKAGAASIDTMEKAGLYGIELSAKVDQNKTRESQFTAIVSRSHFTRESEELLARMEKVYGMVSRISSGSSIKLCLVAEKAADIYPRFAPTMEWDTAAGDAVCRASGCRVTEKDALTPLVYNKPDMHNPWFLVMGPRIDSEVVRFAKEGSE